MFRATFIHPVPHIFDYPRAVQDEPYIDLAAAVDADFLVSRDDDLLALAMGHDLSAKAFRRRFPRLKILTPDKFMATYSGKEKV